MDDFSKSNRTIIQIPTLASAPQFIYTHLTDNSPHLFYDKLFGTQRVDLRLINGIRARVAKHRSARDTYAMSLALQRHHTTPAFI